VRRWAALAVSLGLVLIGTMLVSSRPASAASLQGWALTPTSVYLEWTPECTAGGTGLPCEGYTTEYYTISLKNGTYETSWESVDTVSNVAVTNYTVIGLQPSTAYQFYVKESCGWCFWSLQSNIVTVTTPPIPPPPNGRPALTILKPVAGQTLEAGATVSIEWSVSDDRDPPRDLVVYLNYTGPSMGMIAGPLSGQTTRLAWTIPTDLRGEGFRISGAVFDAEGAWRPGEGPEFTITAGPDPPEPPTDLGWKITTAILTVATAGLTAGLLLAVRVQLGEWYRRKREGRKGRAVQPRTNPPPPPPSGR